MVFYDNRQFQSSIQLTQIMSTNQKIRKMVTSMKKHSLLHSFQSVTLHKDKTSQTKNHSTMDSQTNMTLFPLLNLTEEVTDKQIEEEDKRNLKTLLTPKNKQKSQPKKTRAFNSLSFRISRRGKEQYYETLHNVSSMLTNPIGTKIRINKSSTNKTDEKITCAYKKMSTPRKVISFLDSPAAMNKTVMGEKLKSKFRQSSSRFRKTATTKRVRPSSSPEKRASPSRKQSISGWYAPQQLELPLF